MRKAAIYKNNMLAGWLYEQAGGEFVFEYDDAYLQNTSANAISLTLPKTQKKYISAQFFPFFSNMLAEGENKKVQSRLLKINEKDQMGLLLATATADTIGNVTVKRTESE